MPRLARPSPLPTLATRPVFLNLLHIQMPVGALTSILHRITGVLLALSAPLAVYLLGRSLTDETGFTQVALLFTHWAAKSVMVILVWALAHHVLAGIRHVLMDIEIGSPLRMARRSAWAVNLGGVAVALLAAVALL